MVLEFLCAGQPDVFDVFHVGHPLVAAEALFASAGDDLDGHEHQIRDLGMWRYHYILDGGRNGGTSEHHVAAFTRRDGDRSNLVQLCLSI